MKHLKVALSDSVQSKIKSIAGRICVGVFETDFTDVGAVVIDDGELDLVNNNQISSFGIPIIVLDWMHLEIYLFMKIVLRPL